MKNLNDFYITDFIKKYFTKSEFKESILDLGCGLLPYKKFYEPKFEKIFLADYENRHGSIDIIFADAHNLPFEDNKFDVILFSEVLEHLKNPEKSIQEISRCLKKGGELIITFPFNYQLHEVPVDMYRFTEFGAKQLFDSNNLKIKKIVRRGNIISLIFTLNLFLIDYILESLTRIKYIGFLLKYVQTLFHKLFELFFKLLFIFLKNSKGSNPSEVGNNLKGINCIYNWHLGYCFVCEKK